MDYDNMEVSDNIEKLEQPEYFFCPICKLKFTKRALSIHRKICKEDENCECQTCIIRREDKKKLSPVRGELSVNKNPTLKSYSDVVIPESLVEVNMEEVACDIIAPNEESNSLSLHETNTTTANEEMEEPASNCEENAHTPNKKNVISDINPTVRSKEKVDMEHDEVTCTRKLFCIFCNRHILHDAYGLHIIGHSKTISSFFHCPFPECKNSFSQPYFLLLHYFMHIKHPLTCKDCYCYYAKCTDIANQPYSYYSTNKSFRCYICLVVCENKKALFSHMHKHATVMPFRCKKCKRSFSCKENLKRHLTLNHVGKKRQCFYCEKTFSSPAVLRSHMKIHTGEVLFPCGVCSKSFSQSGNLKRHMASHVSVKQAQSSNNPVSQSGLTLNSISDGNNNAIVNTGANGCDYIVITSKDVNDSNKTFSQRNVLLNIKSSQPARNTLMEMSNLCIKSKPGRKRKTESKMLLCDKCEKVFAWSYDLEIHKRKHTGEKPYQCGKCDKSFAQSGGVNIHLARHLSCEEK